MDDGRDMWSEDDDELSISGKAGSTRIMARGGLWNPFGDVPKTIECLLSCGAHAIAMQDDQSAASTALESSQSRCQADIFLLHPPRYYVLTRDSRSI